MSTKESTGVKGTVKWFSNRKGFGFIASDALSEEIFVHQTGIVTDGQFRTLQESSAVKFDVEKEEGTGKLKAVNVTNEDGTPIVPPPRQPRRARAPGVGGGRKEDEEEVAAPHPADTMDGDDTKENKKKAGAGGGGRRGRNNGAKAAPAEKKEPAASAANPVEKKEAAPKDPPFHSVLSEDTKAAIEKTLTLGNRTTIDVAFGKDTRVKLGQGGYTAICLQSPVKVGEGTFACDATGNISFTWARALECKDGAWVKCTTDSFLASLSLLDAKVGPVGASETAATFWGDDKPDPKDAFEANGFQMRRVVLTRPTGGGGGGNRYRRGGGGGGGGRGRNNNNKKPAEAKDVKA